MDGKSRGAVPLYGHESSGSGWRPVSEYKETAKITCFHVEAADADERGARLDRAMRPVQDAGSASSWIHRRRERSSVCVPRCDGRRGGEGKLSVERNTTCSTASITEGHSGNSWWWPWRMGNYLASRL